MKKILTLLSFLMGATCASAQSYPVAAIPDSLKKNTHAVVRDFDARYDIISPAEYTTTVKYAVTVLDEKGKSYGNLREYYGGVNSIESITGSLYDKDGTWVRSLKKKEIADEAVFGISLADDNRVKKHSFGTMAYPYTTVYEVTQRFNSTFFVERWSPQLSEQCSLEKATLTIHYPANIRLRFKAIKLSGTPVISGAYDDMFLHMSASGILAGNEADGFTPISDRSLPCVLLAVDTFSLFGYSGSMATWKGIGTFLYHLNLGRDVLSPEVRGMVHQLADTCKTEHEKINVLYHYLQKNTRYVSIQLGVGGWQTFDAGFVCEKKYGDCKALSNFMMSLLKEAGITSYTATVYAGRDGYIPLLEDFPASVFNHVILCIPHKDDTTWLECTSSDLPAGYLSDFTGDRKVLLHTPSGGVVVKTPAYGIETNRLTRKPDLTLNDKDELDGSIVSGHKGLFWNLEYHLTSNQPKNEVETHLNKALGFANYKINRYKVNDHAPEGMPFLEEELNVTATTEASRSGNNLLLSTGVFPFSNVVISRSDSLNPNFQIGEGYIMNDTVVIHLPADYSLGAPAKQIDMEFPFGSFKMNYVLADKRTLIRYSTYKIISGIYPSTQFKNYRKLRNEASWQSKNKVILTKA